MHYLKSDKMQLEQKKKKKKKKTNKQKKEKISAIHGKCNAND